MEMFQGQLNVSALWKSQHPLEVPAPLAESTDGIQPFFFLSSVSLHVVVAESFLGHKYRDLY